MSTRPATSFETLRHIALGLGAVLGSLAPGSALAANDRAAATAPLQLQLGKPEQRGLGIRTLTAASARNRLSLPGRVVVDPRQHHRIAAGEAGLIEEPDAGFPLAGSEVTEGTVLAWLRPTLAEPARRDLQAQLATAQRDVALGRLQIKRFSIDESQAVEGNLVTPSIRIVSDYRAALARVAHLERSLAARTAIRAPATGKLLRSKIEAGRVARSGETLFEIDGSAQAVIEAPVSSDARSIAANATAVLDGGGQALVNLGERFDPASRSWLARFAVPAAADATRLLPGEVVSVQLAALPDAPIRLPADSLFEHDHRHWVWLHQTADVFVAHSVDVARRDAGTVLIDADLQPDQRIVVTGGGALTARLREHKDPQT